MTYFREMLINGLREIFRKATGEDFESMIQIKADSSERNIFRLKLGNESYVAVHNIHVNENTAYISFSESFLNAGLNVPRVISVSDDSVFYLVEDIGDTTLFRYSESAGKDDLQTHYKRALDDLVMFQTLGKSVIDFSKCFPSSDFDETVIRNDLEKFSNYFLERIAERNLPSKQLKDATEIFIEIARKNNHGYFMYRDFQPRNIMINKGSLYYIDFQSGMRGPALYDLVSFLYSGSIDLEESRRNDLLQSYCNKFSRQTGISNEEFMSDYGEFVLLRLVQVLGSYAFVHSERNNSLILGKIPKAISNLSVSINRINNPVLKELAEFILVAGRKFYS